MKCDPIKFYFVRYEKPSGFTLYPHGEQAGFQLSPIGVGVKKLKNLLEF
jgi:hypothetical protein